MVNILTLKPIQVKLIGAKVNLKAGMTWRLPEKEAANLVKRGEVEIIRPQKVKQKKTEEKKS